MEMLKRSYHFLFEKINQGYEKLRCAVVDYGQEALSQMKTAIVKTLNRGDVFEVQSKVRTIQDTEFSPMTQSALSFFDDFEIVSGIPVFTLRPEGQNIDHASVPSTSKRPMQPSPFQKVIETKKEPEISEADHYTCSVFSNDETLLVSGHQDGTIMVWDAQHGTFMKSLVGPHGGAISDLVFYKSSSRILIACDFSGVTSIWDVRDETREPVVINCNANWEKTRVPSVEGHWPKLCKKGSLLVYPVQVVLERLGDDARALSKRLFSISSMGRKFAEDVNSNAAIRQTELYSHFCILHIFDTRAEGVIRKAVYSHEEGSEYCWGTTVEIPSRRLFIPLLADSHDYALSTTDISHDSRGLLIGVSSRPNGHLIVWPDFHRNDQQSYRLDGMVGRWSPCDQHVVSWDAPLKTALKSEIGICRVWDLHSCIASAEPCLQNGQDEHPNFMCKPSAELACPSGNSIYWCDFVSLHPASSQHVQHLGVATCSVGEHVQIVLWDFKLAIPVQTFVPGVLSREIIFHTQQAWADRWVLVKPSWGLNFISVSADRTRLGFFAAGANSGYIYDTEKRIEVLWISATDKNGNQIQRLLRNSDFVFSPKGDRFLTLSEETITIWMPQILQSQRERGASWLALTSSDSDIEDGKLRCKFSRDGQMIGLMRLYGPSMDIWNLQTGSRMVLQPKRSNPKEKQELNEESALLDSITGMPLSPISTTAGIAGTQPQRFVQFCISKNGDMVATCMSDMSVLLWDLTKGTPVFRKIADLRSRYFAAWDVCFTEGPDGDPVNVVVCEDNGHLVWIAIHPHPKVLMRKDADAKKRCTCSADGRRAVLMPDDIQVRVWDLIEKMPLFSCTYHVWLGKSGLIPFPHNVAMDGMSALVGLDAYNRTVLCHPKTTYANLKDVSGDKKVSWIPRHLAVDESMNWFVTDKFQDFDFDRTKKRPSMTGNRLSSSTAVSVSSSSSLKGSLSRNRQRTSARVRFDQDEEKPNESEIDTGPSEQPRTRAEMYPDIRERLSNENLWDYLRTRSRAQQDVADIVDCDGLEVRSIDGQAASKRLPSKGLRPDIFLVISSDGTKIACMDRHQRLNVWSTHATEGCIPTSHMLMSAADLDISELEKELDAFGPGIINFQDHTGLTLLMYAVYKKNVALLKCLLSWAKRRDVKISLRVTLRGKNGQSQVLNALNLALGSRSPEVTRLIMKYLLEGVCTEIERSVILKDSLVKLSGVYPSILLKILDNKRIMIRLHELTVPEWAFARSEYKVDANNQLIPTPSHLEEMWQSKKLAKKEGLFRKPALKRTSAYAAVMPYPDVAQVGMRGIVRPLLFNKVPHHIFATWPMRCVIKFKWGLYGKRLIIEDCVHYLALLFFFTLYALLIGFLVNEDNDEDSNKLHESEFYEDGTVAVLIISVLLAIGMLVRKTHQMHAMWLSGKWKGIFYWMYDYFNILETVCYVFIVFLVPMAHFRGPESRLLAAFVASTCILLWSKTLYYFQAFKGTGPLVIMIREILKDIRFYLFLMFAILMGFAIAFFVLFRSDRSESCETRVGDNSTNTATSRKERLEKCKEEKEGLKTLFGTFDRTLITMFSMLLGEVSDVANLLFDVQRGLKLVGIVMFILYMLAVTIVLLNLLIAIMGDGFDRVKATDMSYFLKKRAQIIDDMETGLSTNREAEISSKISTYLHVLMPKHKSEIHQQSGEWQGRMRDAGQRFKHDVIHCFHQYHAEVKTLAENQRRLERRIEELINPTAPPSFMQSRSESTGSQIVSPSARLLSSVPSRSHGGGRPLQLDDVSEGSDFDDLNDDDAESDPDAP